MERTSYEHGVPSWVDLGSPDVEAACAFYGGLFGWDLEEGPPEAGGYRLAKYKDQPVGGIGPQQQPGPSVWGTYVSVTDADETIEKVNANGGKPLMPVTDVMGLGRMAFFSDPAGAVIGVWQPLAFPGAGRVNEPNTYAWSELVTTDMDAAKSFYSAVFGWGHETHGPGDPAMPGGYTEWKVGGSSVAGGMLKPPMMPAEVPPHWGVYFSVADADATAAKAKELGGSTIVGPMDIEPGRMYVLADPLGAVFQVMQLKEIPS